MTIIQLSSMCPWFWLSVTIILLSCFILHSLFNTVAYQALSSVRFLSERLIPFLEITCQTLNQLWYCASSYLEHAFKEAAMSTKGHYLQYKVRLIGLAYFREPVCGLSRGSLTNREVRLNSH